MKKCTICKKEKPYAEFYKDRTRGTGYSNRCKECNRKKYLSKDSKSHYKKTGITGYWTKYGGVRRFATVNQYDDPYITDGWICQSCTRQQTKELPHYPFEYPEGEFIRVCSDCFHTGCLTLKSRLTSV